MSWGSSIRLKCPKRIINTLGIPEKGFITVHIKGNTATVSYDVTGSSMRINLGAAFANLFKGENNATVTIKASENKIELFHKEDEKSLFPIFKKSARYADGWRYCSSCQHYLPK
jgi:Lhr-like helicase